MEQHGDQRETPEVDMDVSPELERSELSAKAREASPPCERDGPGHEEQRRESEEEALLRIGDERSGRAPRDADESERDEERDREHDELRPGPLFDLLGSPASDRLVHAPSEQ